MSLSCVSVFEADPPLSPHVPQTLLAREAEDVWEELQGPAAEAHLLRLKIVPKALDTINLCVASLAHSS